MEKLYYGLKKYFCSHKFKVRKDILKKKEKTSVGTIVKKYKYKKRVCQRCKYEQIMKLKRIS